jgi:hypothetical protein
MTGDSLLATVPPLSPPQPDKQAAVQMAIATVDPVMQAASQELRRGLGSMP